MSEESTTWQQRAEMAEAATFRLQAKLWFLVKEVRAYVAEASRFVFKNDRLAALEQSAGTAESVLREDEPWRAVRTRIELLEERAFLSRVWIRQSPHLGDCALKNGGACSCGRSDLLRGYEHEQNPQL